MLHRKLRYSRGGKLVYHFSMKENSKLGARRWLSIILIGLIGQVAWAIENNYINLWVYSQSHNSDHITWMTIASAVVATVTTFFMGALSDRLGKRKVFIATGYSIWGVTVFLFGLMSLTNMQNLTGGDLTKAVLFVGIGNVILDCLMTFFGSTGNDACFNAFVTDSTNEKNRPLVESVLSVMPLIAMAIMLGVGLILGVPDNALAPADAAPKWLIFFLVMGILTTAVGVASFFLLPKDKVEPNRDEAYMAHLVKGFRPSSVKSNPLFYIALLTFLCFNVAVDSFMPFIMVYLQNLPSVKDSFILTMAVIMGVASLIVIVVGFFLERIGKLKVLFPSIGLMIVGALSFFFAGESMALVIVCGSVLMTGYLLGTASLGAEIRDQTPENDVGAMQAVRMVFVVMVPMIIGPAISNMLFTEEIKTTFGTGADAFELVEKAPNRSMFIVTAVAAAIALVPAIWLVLAIAKDKKAAQIENKEKGE